MVPGELTRFHRARPRVHQGCNDDWGGAEQGDVATASSTSSTNTIGSTIRGRCLRQVLTAAIGKLADVQRPHPYAAGTRGARRERFVRHVQNTMPHFRTELMVNLGEPDENEGRSTERSRDPRREPRRAPPDRPRRERSAGCRSRRRRIFRTRSATAGFEEGVDYEYGLGEEGHGSGDIDQRSGRWNCSTILPRPLDRRGKGPRSPRWTTSGDADSATGTRGAVEILGRGHYPDPVAVTAGTAAIDWQGVSHAGGDDTVYKQLRAAEMISL